ncbi:hypothetical protein D5086_024727 [Populus alba]|uniref:Uncharacterized protein n=1 Tax=Populus alba TaxID=43335 RepID=A0ACC4B6T3_POPAL
MVQSHRGDMGIMHQDGYLEIKDRSKDVIISVGENISSVEAESVLYTPPAFHEAAVVFKDELPRTSTGKIQKVVLKEIAKGMGPKK